MSSPDDLNTEQLNIYEVAQQMANVARHLHSALDDDLQLPGDSGDTLEARLQQAKQTEIQRRKELDSKREKAKQEFAARWKRG
jgi:hypothetical protein